MVQKAEAIVRDNPFIEFRLDYISRPTLALPRLKRFIDYHPEVLAIATCRRAVNGGRFRGSVASQREVLLKAASSGFQLIDLELQSAKAMKPKEFSKLHSRAAIILSSHDFRATRKLEETLARMEPFPVEFLKIVSTATCLADNVTMMKFLERHGNERPMVGLCMGEQGIISRVLGVRAGSVFTFASATPGEETAPGQVSARALRDTYRIEQVDAATRVYGLVGDPVTHSLSPLLMNTAFRRENLNAVYLSLHARKLDDLLTCVREIPIHGFSVTMPYKEAIFKHLENTDPVTARIGACNTVIRSQDGKLYGFNTDVTGILRPLEQRINIAKARVLVIGAGGAARAAVFGLRERGAEVYILNRTTSVGQKLARQARARFLKRPELKKLAFDVIINATPVGMGSSRESPLKENEINARYVFDLVYAPPETRLTRLARARGAEVIPGLEMFVHQAARQFEIWTGKPAPAAEMQHALELSLAAQAAATRDRKA
jgi:3-dehydroquinate dehydratase/shikimate dehydrogenase